MKRYCFWLLFVSAFAGAMSYCTLDKEPALPTGATNEDDPVFLSGDITAISYDTISAKVRLSTRGILKILHHGWAWSENVNPTIQNDTIDLGILNTDSFDTKIPRLSFGKTYRLRPYATNGSGTTYGLEKTMTMNIAKLGDITVLTNSACQLLVQGNVQSTVPLTDYGVLYLTGIGIPTIQKNDGKWVGGAINNNIFSTSVPNLLPLTTYSVRAYAVSSVGIGYSPIKQVTTPASASLKADFSINTDEELFQGAIVQFTNSSTGTTTYNWNFGDGDSSAMASPIHTFNTLGKMLVRLSAKNASGCTTTKEVNLNIITDPFKNYWVPISGGSFTMGCTPEQGTDCKDDEKPAHQVTVSSFVFGKTEVTQGQYKAVVGNNPSYFYSCGLDCPVESLQWSDVVDIFIPNLSRKTGRTYTLPTEAQWEYAARGGASAANMTKYAGSNIIAAVAWLDGNKTHPVGQKAPNGYGLYDMSGNVEEWCYDFYSATYYAVSPTVNPTGPLVGNDHAYRGGSVYGGGRVSQRSVCLRCLSVNNVGFRLVRN